MASAIKRSGTWYAKRKDAFGKPQRKATTAAGEVQRHARRAAAQ